MFWFLDRTGVTELKRRVYRIVNVDAMLPLDFWLTKFKEVVAFVFLHKSLSARTTTLEKFLLLFYQPFHVQ